MKKLLLLLALFMLLLIPDPCPAADRAYQPIWDFVAGNTYELDVGDQSFNVEFSESFVGPAPQGRVEIYDGIYVKPVLECGYHSTGYNTIEIECAESGLGITFMLLGNKLIIYDPDAVFRTGEVPDD